MIQMFVVEMVKKLNYFLKKNKQKKEIVLHLIIVNVKMNTQEMNVNIQFVIQNHLMTIYHVLEYQKENVFHLIIVIVI